MLSLGVYDYRFCIENDCYVSDENGNFYSVCRRYYSRQGRFVEQYRVIPLKGSIEGGYITHRITVGGKRKHITAHRMMMNAWVGNKPGFVINHKDGNKLNNSLANLEWCTIAENNAHAISAGLYNPGSLKKFTYKIPTCEWMTIFILHKHCRHSFRELAKMYRCSRGTVERIFLKINRLMEGAKLYE